MRCAFSVCIALLCVISTVHADAQPDPLARLSAENDRLRAQLARDDALIQQLRVEIAALQAQAPTPPTSRPSEPAVAAAAGTRVVFAVEGRGAMLNRTSKVNAEIMKAIGNLKPGDGFGIIWTSDRKMHVLASSLLRPTAQNIARAQAFVQGITPKGEGGGLESLIRTAATYDPKTVWLMTVPDVIDERTELRRAMAARGGLGFRINTLFLPLGGSEDNPGILAMLASRTGGVCVDGEGNEVIAPTPAPKLSAPTHPAPAGPSIFDGK